MNFILLISFVGGVLIGGVLGILVMAMVVISGEASERESLSDAYWRGRKDETRVSSKLPRVDQGGPTTPH